MILRFEVENFFSVRERQVVDLRLPSGTLADPRFRCAIRGRQERVPAVSMFFGANASGKTTALRALSFALDFATESFKDNKPGDNILSLPFWSDEQMERPTTIVVEFSPPDALMADASKKYEPLYRYELTIISEKGKLIVGTESLGFSKGSRRFTSLFSRERLDDGYRIRTHPNFQLAENDPRRQVRNNVGLISSLLQFGHPPSESLRTLFQFGTHQNIYFNKFTNEETSVNNLLSDSDDLLKELNKKIRMIDLGIERVEIRKVDGENRPLFFHKGLSNPLSLHYQSDGTKSFYLSFIDLALALQLGAVAVMDELDSDLHPHLMDEIVRWFQNEKENPRGAQLIMACHNASILSELVKEEVWLAQKDRTGATTYTCLAKLRGLRRDTNLYAKYLAGAFGAVPHFG